VVVVNQVDRVLGGLVNVEMLKEADEVNLTQFLSKSKLDYQKLISDQFFSKTNKNYK
jgi:hypothetical protein